MKRLSSVFLVIMLALPLVVHPVMAAEEPQKVFDVTMMLRISQTQINGSLAWVGTFDIYVKLTDPNYRAYFDDLAKRNETNATLQFASLVYNLVYNNLKKDFNDKLSGGNLSAIIYVPPGGPVRVTGRWSAIVRFSIIPFLVPDGRYLKCPFYGHLDFTHLGKVYSFTWKRLTIVLPRDYRIGELVPKPNDISDNVAVWENGDYIPYIELYNPVYLFEVFINSTKKRIELSFEPDEGYVQFNATFTGMKIPKSVVNLLLTVFREKMKIMSISAQETGDGVKVIGVAKPDVAYRETRRKKVWLVSVKLPGHFDEVVVRNGKYALAPDGTLIITYTEKKSDYLPYAIVGALIIAGLMIWFRRRGGPSIEEPGETSDVSEKVDIIEIDETGEGRK